MAGIANRAFGGSRSAGRRRRTASWTSSGGLGKDRREAREWDMGEEGRRSGRILENEWDGERLCLAMAVPARDLRIRLQFSGLPVTCLEQWRSCRVYRWDACVRSVVCLYIYVLIKSSTWSWFSAGFFFCTCSSQNIESGPELVA